MKKEARRRQRIRKNRAKRNKKRLKCEGPLSWNP